jgi:hypothetical protein
MARKLTVAQQALRDAKWECSAAGIALHEHESAIAHVLQIKTSPSYVSPEAASDAVRALYRWSLAYLNLERLEYPDAPGN